MIEIVNVEVYGWEAAIRGMRNPMNSWDKSDSFYCDDEHCFSTICPIYHDCANHDISDIVLGKNDLSLMKKLVKAGTDHSKFMRYIIVTCDIVAPDYWFKEFSTYRVGVTENSTSTMHKIAAKEFTLDDFSYGYLLDGYVIPNNTDKPINSYETLTNIISTLNAHRELYLDTGDKKYWYNMIQLLPMSYNYRRTVIFNYQVLRNMYHSRKNHKLDEWRSFCEWVESLPYSEIITL